MQFIKGSESGDYIPPKGNPHYETLLKSSYFLEKDNDNPDESLLIFPIEDKDSFFEDNPIINIVVDESDYGNIDKELYLTIILKEEISRKAKVIKNEKLNFDDANEFEKSVNFREDHFKEFSLSSSINVDAIIYSKGDNKIPNIEAFKRFTLRFSGIAGIFSIIEQPPEFFSNNDGGPNSLTFLKIDYENENDLKEKNSCDIVKVYINSSFSTPYKNMLNQISSSTSDTLSIMWTTNIISQIILQVFEILDDYPNDIENEDSVVARIFKLYDIDDERKFTEAKDRIKRSPQKINTFIEDKLNLGENINKFRGKKRK